MIAIIASIFIVISVLISALIGFSPNARSIMESDFMRSAKNNAYICAWEDGQLAIRTGNLLKGGKITLDLGTLSEKNSLPKQKLEAIIELTSDLSIEINQN